MALAFWFKLSRVSMRHTSVCPPVGAQGGGKRKGAVAIYLEPWHGDIFSWLDLRKNHGKEEARARDLFYALWIPDLFMKRVEANGVSEPLPCYWLGVMVICG